MTDLVKTLRRSYWIGDNVTTAALAEAADEIERLERIAEWRLGLHFVATLRTTSKHTKRKWKRYEMPRLQRHHATMVS